MFYRRALKRIPSTSDESNPINLIQLLIHRVRVNEQWASPNRRIPKKKKHRQFHKYLRASRRIAGDIERKREIEPVMTIFPFIRSGAKSYTPQAALVPHKSIFTQHIGFRPCCVFVNYRKIHTAYEFGVKRYFVSLLSSNTIYPISNAIHSAPLFICY